jgi:peptidoglycan/LPS O-acetylase OafA/YrhL
MKPVLADVLPRTPAHELNLDLEALRGYAALFVVWDHAVLYQKLLDPAYSPQGIFSYQPSGHFCVLLFFGLSGYVIGLSNPRPLTWVSSGTYLKKRLVRLYPIYLLALLLALVTYPVSRLGLGTVLGNAALLPVPGLAELNAPAWSLHYELVYYLLFIPLSIWRVPLRPALLLALLVAGAQLVLPAHLGIPALGSYAYGLLFWLGGLLLSRRLASVAPARVPAQVLVSCLLFVLCIDQYNLFDTLLHKAVQAVAASGHVTLHTYWSHVALPVFDLAYLPYALVLLLVFTGRRVPHLLGLLRALLLFSALNLVYVVRHALAGDLRTTFYALPTLFLLAALGWQFWRRPVVERLSRHILRGGAWLGSLSYGIYLVHYPLLLLLHQLPLLSGTKWSFSLRFALLLLLTIGLSYVLEKQLQPYLRARFFKPKPVLTPVLA